MIAIGLLFVRMLRDCFKSRRQLEAEILVLRHQLNVLRQRAPRRLICVRPIVFYLFGSSTFPDSAVSAVHRAPSDYPSGKKGDNFTVLGIPCLGLNGGPMFKHNEAFSFQIAIEDQEETDRYWNAIVGNGGPPVRVVQGQVADFLADHAAQADAGHITVRPVTAAPIPSPGRFSPRGLRHWTSKNHE